MTDKERDEIYDVVWSGEEGLTGDRESRPTTWTPLPRQYTWSGKYAKKAKGETTQPSTEIFNPLED